MAKVEDYPEYQEDIGLEETAHNFMERFEPDPGLERPEVTDGLGDELEPIAVEPRGLSGRAIELYRRHPKGIKQLGVLGVGSFGLGLGARAAFPR